jgi:hypothetical protein
MKKVVLNFFSSCVIACIIFGGCKKDDDSPVSGGFDGKITAKVENGSAYNTDIKKVVALIGAYLDNKTLKFDDDIAYGTYSGDGFTITLPTTVEKKYLMSVRDFFEDVLKVSGDVKYSDSGVLVVDVDFFALNKDNQWLDYFVHSTGGDKSTTCFFVYADKEVTVTGGSNISVLLKSGWNRLYYSSGKNKISTKTESGLKWYISQDLK